MPTLTIDFDADPDDGYYADRIAAKVANLVPEVVALVAGGKLHQFDAEWIGGVPKERQLETALKFVVGAGAKLEATVETRHRRVRSGPMKVGRPKLQGAKA